MNIKVGDKIILVVELVEMYEDGNIKGKALTGLSLKLKPKILENGFSLEDKLAIEIMVVNNGPTLACSSKYLTESPQPFYRAEVLPLLR